MSEPKVGTEASLPPILCTIRQAAAMIARGETFIYGAIGDGRIKAVKSDNRTLVVVESLRSYASSLPAAKIRPQYQPPQRLRQQSA